jgi:heme a synthase
VIDAARAQRTARMTALLATIAAALVLIVVASSAWLRLAHSGLGCDDWPACYGAFRDAGEAARPVAPHLAEVRATHRISAAVAGLAIVFCAVVWLSGTRAVRGITPLVIALLALTVALSVLGRYTPGAQLPAVAAGNMLGGMLLLALAWSIRIALAAPAATPAPVRLRWMARAGFVLVAAQIVVGALVSTKYAAMACTSFPDCHGAWWPPRLAWMVFDPWQPIAGIGADLALLLRQSLHLVHRWGALLALAGAGLLVMAAHGAGGVLRQQGVALGALTMLQCALGVAMVVAPPHLALTVAHDLVAALMLASALALVWCLALRNPA